LAAWRVSTPEPILVMEVKTGEPPLLAQSPTMLEIVKLPVTLTVLLGTMESRVVGVPDKIVCEVPEEAIPLAASLAWDSVRTVESLRMLKSPIV